MSRNLRILLAWLIGGAALADRAATEDGTAPASVFTYRGVGADGSEVVFEATSNGLTSVRLGTQTVASGDWHVEGGNWVLHRTGVVERLDACAAKTLEVLAPDHVRIRHSGSNLTTTFDYAFAGEDVRITARVDNGDPDRALEAVVFRGLTLAFNGTPAGYLQTWDSSTLRSLGQRRRGFHPSFETLLGGSYACDGAFGVGLSPLYRQLEPTLFWWAGGRDLHYIVPAAIPPGGARTFAMTMRVSRNRNWQHLLEPYRAHFTATFGPVRYKADPRPFTRYQAADDAHMSGDNPHGWNWYRFDRATHPTPWGGKGMADFVACVTDACVRAGAQGVILWAQTGNNPRGCNFRPDFDVLPPEVETNAPLLRAILAAGCRLGATARPGEIATPVAWGRDDTVRVHPDEPTQMETLLKRFDLMAGRGFNAYYLDTFGDSFNDIRIMQAVRARLGPDVPTFTEFWTDVSLVYSGAYMQMGWDGKSMAHREFWNRLEPWAYIRWLLPGVQAVSPVGTAEHAFADLIRERKLRVLPGSWAELQAADAKSDPARVPSPMRFLFQNGITPMITIGTSSAVPLAAEAAALAPEFVRKGP